VFTGSDLVFYAETHEYFLPPGREGGRRVPNVTTVLRDVGVSEDYGRVDSDDLEHRRQLGSAVHEDVHAFDDQDLDWTTVDTRVRPYVDAWATWRANHQAIPMHRERRVYHPIYGYCGTLDGIFEIAGGRRVLVDLKTGDPESAGAQWQTAAYLEAFRAEHPALEVHERWAVQLTPDLSVPYRNTPYSNWQDFQVFLAFLTTYAHQRRRRIR
jgi:hypothetical protein